MFCFGAGRIVEADKVMMKSVAMDRRT